MRPVLDDNRIVLPPISKEEIKLFWTAMSFPVFNEAPRVSDRGFRTRFQPLGHAGVGLDLL